MSEYIVTLLPVYMESSGEYLGSVRLRKFQKDLVDVKDGIVLLSAPTGSGKTVTLLTDPDRRVAIGLYPNNELLCSQIAGLHSFINNYLEMKPDKTSLLEYCVKGYVEIDYSPLNIYVSDKPVDFFGRKIKEIGIAGFSGEVVKAVANKGKLNELIRVSDELGKMIEKNEDKYVIVLATPDTFFLLVLYAYSNFDAVGRLLHYIITYGNEVFSFEDLDELMRKIGLIREKLANVARVLLPVRESTIFIDEYHLYGFYELSSFTALLYLLKHVHGWEGRLVLSSATPNFVFQEKIGEKLGMNVKQINGLNQVKETGDGDELVRGPTNIVFMDVKTKGRNRVSKLYMSSELAYDLLNREFFKKQFKKCLKSGKRIMVMLEKVSHAELFTEKFYSIYGVKPKCAYSMFREDICSENEDWNIIVGTGAKIGQGVEYPGVIFGVVARIESTDFLQSISRVGRKYPGESIVLVPLDTELLKELDNVEIFSRGKVSYVELAKWVENDGRPYMKKKPSGFENIYSTFISIRERLVKLVGLALHYRVSGAYMEEYMKQLKQISGGLENIFIHSSPDNLYTLLMFRATGPSVHYCRELKGELKCFDRGEDLGTIIRNYDISSRDGRLVIKGFGRGEINVECENIQALVDLVNLLKQDGKRLLIDWYTLKNIYKCSLRVEVNDGAVELLTSVETELEDQLFLIPEIMNDEFAEYIYRTGRGLRVKLNKGSLILLYI
uniref:DEAD/DEAH box helicase n=1 Tax=Staphylothermus marinus TaxID=2280 RepID=A0A7J3PL71_STAMA